MIGIRYYETLLTESELQDFEQYCSEHDISFRSAQYGIQMNASLDFFIPVIQLVMSPDVVSGICSGVLTTAITATTKYIAHKLWNKFHNNPIAKLQSNKITYEPANIHITLNENNLVLPVNEDTAFCERIVDNFLQHASKSTPPERVYLMYDEHLDAMISKTESEIIEEAIRKQKNHQTDK